MNLRDLATKFIAEIDPTTATGRIEINTVLVFLQAIDDAMRNEVDAARSKPGREETPASPAE